MPAIIPVVVHHSDSGWTAATDLCALIDLDVETLRLRRWLDVLGEVAGAQNGVEALSAFLEYAFQVGSSSFTSDEIPSHFTRRSPGRVLGMRPRYFDS